MKVNGAALEVANPIDRLDRLTRSGTAIEGLNPAQCVEQEVMADA